MSENWFVQHPEVVRYILEHERVQALIASECDIQDELQQAWDELQAVPSYVERFARAASAELGLEVAQEEVAGTCETCGRVTRTLLNTGSDEFPYYECGTCRHRKARRQNTREMHGRGRRGY